MEQDWIPVAGKLATFKELETSGLSKLLIWMVNTSAVLAHFAEGKMIPPSTDVERAKILT